MNKILINWFSTCFKWTLVKGTIKEIQYFCLITQKSLLKNMRRISHLLIGSLLLLVSCERLEETDKKNIKEVKGDVKYGGTFKMNENEDFKSLYPLSVTLSLEERIASQMYEGLVKLDPKTLEILPALAEKWEVNKTATSYKFHLKKDVRFHDNPCFDDGKGREVTANDFKYCLDRICMNDASNKMYWLFEDKVKGAKAYYQSTTDKNPLKEGVAGIKVIDDYTLQIDLNHSFSGFLNILSHIACVVYPKEAIENNSKNMGGNHVGTGPFKAEKIKKSETVTLEKNPSYWDVDEYGNQLPYLDGLEISFNKTKRKELEDFRKGNLDMVFQLPVEMIDEVVGALEDAKKGGNRPYVLQVEPVLSVYFLGFQHQLKPFDNIDVRKAFNYAIDKESIITYTLQGEGRPALNGIVPPFEGYNNEKVKGYEFSVAKAKEHLTKAGYPKGRGFPEITLQINAGGGGRNIQVAEAIQKMLQKNLGIAINIEQMPLAAQQNKIESGKAIFWKSSWGADYPDPENFLTLLYGKHVPDDFTSSAYLNTMRYKNTTFDSLFNAAAREIDETARYELYQKADQKASDDAAIMPILYDENTRILQVYVKNFPLNAMEHRDMTRVYFDYD